MLQAINSGLDWLSATYTDGRSINRVIHLFHLLNPQDGVTKEWSFRGYNGRQYADGSFAVGYNGRAGRQLIMAKGAMAQTLLGQLYVKPASVSRADIQVTVLFQETQPYLLKTAYQLATERVRKKSRIISNDGGGTVYLGSRKSEVFCRIYDAGVRHGLAEPERMFRYEVEYKKPKALEMYRGLRQLVFSGDDERQVIIATVADEITKRGVGVPFDLDDTKSLASLKIETEKADSRLGWLAQQVNPCVDKMVQDGYDKEYLYSIIFGGENAAL